jgi:hypothetical protein
MHPSAFTSAHTFALGNCASKNHMHLPSHLYAAYSSILRAILFLLLPHFSSHAESRHERLTIFFLYAFLAAHTFGVAKILWCVLRHQSPVAVEKRFCSQGTQTFPIRSEIIRADCDLFRNSQLEPTGLFQRPFPVSASQSGVRRGGLWRIRHLQRMARPPELSENCPLAICAAADSTPGSGAAWPARRRPERAGDPKFSPRNMFGGCEPGRPMDPRPRSGDQGVLECLTRGSQHKKTPRQVAVQDDLEVCQRG